MHVFSNERYCKIVELIETFCYPVVLWVIGVYIWILSAAWHSFEIFLCVMRGCQQIARQLWISIGKGTPKFCFTHTHKTGFFSFTLLICSKIICQFTMNTWKDVVTRSYFKRIRPLFTLVISKVFVTRGWLKGLLILMIISSKIWNRWKNCWTNSLEENEYNLKISLMIQKLNARNKTPRPGKHILPNKTYHWLGPATNHEAKSPGPRFNIKMTSYQYRKSHCGDKTILRPSYLHNGISYTGKTTSLYWIGALGAFAI